MTLWRPSRRAFIASLPLALGAAALPLRARVTGTGRLRLFVLGDWGRDGGHYQRHVAAWMDRHAVDGGCDMVITTGDNFYDYGVSGADDAQWRTSFEDIYSPGLRARPWFPIAGNHDWGGNIWAQLDRSGRGGWHMPWLWYDVDGARFGRPDVHLFFIDTVVWKGHEEGRFAYCGQSLRGRDVAEQRRWLEAALQASCAPTKIVFGHHPIYGVGLDGGEMTLRDLDPILKAAGVTAYVCGHKHCLYHVQGEGLDYLCSGGGSEERAKDTRGRFEPRCVADGSCPPATMRTFIGKAGFTIIDIGGDGMSFRFVDRDGNVTPPTAIASRGRPGSDCIGPLAVGDDVRRERATARAKTLIPCAKIF